MLFIALFVVVVVVVVVAVGMLFARVDAVKIARHREMVARRGLGANQYSKWEK